MLLIFARMAPHKIRATYKKLLKYLSILHKKACDYRFQLWKLRTSKLKVPFLWWALYIYIYKCSTNFFFCFKNSVIELKVNFLMALFIKILNSLNAKALNFVFRTILKSLALSLIKSFFFASLHMSLTEAATRGVP